MWFIAVLGFIVVSLIVLLFLHQVIRIRQVPAYVTVLAFVAFSIPASTVVLLPIDLASGRADEMNRHEALQDWPLSYLNHTALLKIWRVMYWLSFSLTLTVLPITQSFVESGYRDHWQKLVSSVRQNLKFQAFYLSIGVFGILYIALNTKLSSFGDFKSLLIALANTWGLFLAINFLGHGLVNLPRHVWRSADYLRHMRETERQAAQLFEQLEEAEGEEAELANQIVAYGSTSADKDWLEEMSFLIPAAVAKAREQGSRTPSNSWFRSHRAGTKDPSEAELADLMSKIRNNKRERYAAEWKHLVTRYTYLLDCTSPSSEAVLQHRTFRSRLPPKAAYYFYVGILPVLKRLLAILLSALSFSILWAEILINSENSEVRYVVLPISQWNVELYSALLLAYMACCCYWTLLRLKIFDRYALLNHGHTSQSSLFFYASYCCRVTIPLSYNFITLLPAELKEVSTFSRFLASAIDLQPLGTAFNNWFPLYILVPVMLTSLNSYDWLKRVLGIGKTWADDDDDVGASSDHGRANTLGDSAAYGRAELRRAIALNFGELPSRSSPSRDLAHLQSRIDNDSEDVSDTSPFLQNSTTPSTRTMHHEADDVPRTHSTLMPISAVTRGWTSLWSSVQHGVDETAEMIKNTRIMRRSEIDPDTI